jgi:hypothetical protein
MAHPRDLLFLPGFHCGSIRETGLDEPALGSVIALVVPPRTKSSQGLSTGMVRQINFLSMCNDGPYHAVALEGDHE